MRKILESVHMLYNSSSSSSSGSFAIQYLSVSKMKLLLYIRECIPFAAAITRLSRQNGRGWLKATTEGLSFVAKKGNEFTAELEFSAGYFDVFYCNAVAPSFEAVISLETLKNELGENVESHQQLLMYCVAGNSFQLHFFNDMGDTVARNLCVDERQEVLELPIRDLRGFHVSFDSVAFSRVIPYLSRGARNEMSVTPSLITFNKIEGFGLAENTDSLMYYNQKQRIITGIDDEVTTGSLHMTDTNYLLEFIFDCVYIYEISDSSVTVVLQMPIDPKANVYTYFP